MHPLKLFIREFSSLFRNFWTRRIVAILVLFGLAASVILPNLGSPRAIIFDEAYYITHAQKYLNGDFLLQTHPPLGKLLIALGQSWLYPDAPSDEFAHVEKVATAWNPETDITGYRLMPAIFGILNPLVAFAILLLIVRNELFAFGLALLVVFDNSLIVQSRAALLDSPFIFFLLAAVLVFGILVRWHLFPARFQKKTPPLYHLVVAWAVWGMLIGCAANVKLSGLVAGSLVAIYGLWLLSMRQFRRAIFFGIVFILFFAIVYLGLWQIHFAIATHFDPNNDYGISQLHRDILTGLVQVDPLTRFAVQFQDGMRYHINSSFDVGKLDLSDPKEIGSPWYWWLVGGRAISYRWETIDNGVHQRFIFSLGNPITTLVALIGIISGISLLIIDALRHTLDTNRRRWLLGLVTLWLSYMIPMMLTTRVTYLFHYLPALVIGVLLFGLVLSSLPKRFPHLQRDAMVVTLILLVFMFWVYKPLTYYEPLTRYEFQQRNIFPAWNLRCSGCTSNTSQ
jgi:dolichyl-phosphate-mannose--protein O-mannosyl transferase